MNGQSGPPNGRLPQTAATLAQDFFARDLDLHFFGFIWVCGQGTPKLKNSVETESR